LFLDPFRHFTKVREWRKGKEFPLELPSTNIPFWLTLSENGRLCPVMAMDFIVLFNQNNTTSDYEVSDSSFPRSFHRTIGTD